MIRRVALTAVTFAVFGSTATASADVVTERTRPSCCAAGTAAPAPLYEVVALVAVLLFVIGVFALVTVRSRGPEEPDDHDGGGPEGPGPASPHPGGNGPLTTEPDCWPGLEPQFAAHVGQPGTRALSSSRSPYARV